jgi:fructosamine-3-kinase
VLAVAAAVAQACGLGVESVRSVAGGDICRAWQVRLVDGTPAFAKTFTGDPAMFEAEAHSLRWLAEGGAPVPRVIGVGADVLVLAWLDAGRPSRAAAHRLGAALATMHRAGANSFGAPWPGFAGRLRLANTPAPTWPEFFAGTRLLPLARQAHDAGALEDVAAIERVAARLASVGGPAEAPARLHGDLWSGNILWSTEGAWLVDPAAYGGHRETDLAMLQLFGAPYLDDIVTAYQEVMPLANGWQDRVELHQMYPLLAHAVMFGGGYGARASAIARRYS